MLDCRVRGPGFKPQHRQKNVSVTQGLHAGITSPKGVDIQLSGDTCVSCQTHYQYDFVRRFLWELTRRWVSMYNYEEFSSSHHYTKEFDLVQIVAIT